MVRGARGDRDLFVGKGPAFSLLRRGAHVYIHAPDRSCGNAPARPRLTTTLRRRRDHAPESGVGVTGKASAIVSSVTEILLIAQWCNQQRLTHQHAQGAEPCASA